MKYEIKTRRIAQNWEEGYFTGNGTIGAIVMCHPGDERIIFNHEELFLHTTELECFPDMSDEFNELRRLKSEDDIISAATRFFNTARQRGMKNKIIPEDITLYPDSYYPPFELKINYSAPKENYERCLNTKTSEITAVFGTEEDKIKESVFTSHISNTVFIELTSQKNISCEIIPESVEAKNDFEKRLEKLCILHKSLVCEQGDMLFRTDMNNGYYCGRISISTNGKKVFSGSGMSITGATRILITVTIGVNEPAAMSEISDYAVAFLKSTQKYSAQFNSCKIELEENEFFESYIEDLFSEPHTENKLIALMQKLYYAGRYYAIGSFGRLPPNSQGLWSGNVSGRTLCDYISNIELEMAFWSIFSGNFAEKALCCFDFIEALIPDFEENARKLFGMNGIMVTSRFTTSGLAFHFSPGFTHIFWISGGAWISQLYYEYYRYTGDEEFLRSRALPFMCRAAQFYMDYVRDGEIFPSVSPENSPYRKTFCMAGRNAAMDIAAIRELFTSIEESCKLLGIENKYKITLPEYAYTEDGTLMEWADISADKAYSHRHLSQIYAIMPGFEAHKNKKLRFGIEAAIKKRLENGFWNEENGTCGWSVMHLINAYARLENTDGIEKALQFFFEHYVRENMTACLTYSTQQYQIDANLGYVNALYEMTVFSDENEIVLLPCLPKFIKALRAENLLLRGGHIIKELSYNESGAAVKILPKKDCRIKIRFGSSTNFIELKKNSVAEILLTQK